jgi:hypothetical protein
LCQEYFTEKVVKTLWLNVIPVVMGLPDYSDFLPPGSYLDVRNFSSPQKLASFMQGINKDDRLYNDFIEAKKRYKCVSEVDQKSVPYACRLCHYLHKNKYVREIVYDIRKFWGPHERCQTPRDFFRRIASKDFHASLLDPAHGFEYDSRSIDG